MSTLVEANTVKTFKKITFGGGDWCVCEDHPEAIAQITRGESDFAVEDVQMTQAEFDALPEFQG